MIITTRAAIRHKNAVKEATTSSDMKNIKGIETSVAASIIPTAQIISHKVCHKPARIPRPHLLKPSKKTLRETGSGERE